MRNTHTMIKLFSGKAQCLKIGIFNIATTAVMDCFKIHTNDRSNIMRPMESFLYLFFLLEKCYDIDPCLKPGESLDLPGFLGEINPTLWSDGRAADPAIFDDWVEQTDIPHLNEKNVISAIINFLSFYEDQGFYFGRTREILKEIANDEMLKDAAEFSKFMYEKFSYND